MRIAFVSASAVALLVAAALAATQESQRRFTVDDVVLAFASRGIALGMPTWRDFGVTSDDDRLGVSSPELTAKGSDGSILLEKPFEKAEYYVFVATDTALAERYYEELVSLGQTPDTFDLRARNVLVSSDSSFTRSGMTAEKKGRIRAAIDALASTS